MITDQGKHRGFGLWMCTALVVGNMIGSGVFLLPASLAVYGSISLAGWLLTTLGAITLALVFARLARLHPVSGGPYAYSREGFGDFAGFLVAWGYWISLWAGNAAIAVAFAGYLVELVPILAGNSKAQASVAIVAIWLLTAINAIGVRAAGRVQVITTVLKILPLVAIASLGLFHLQLQNLTPINASQENPLAAITAAAALTLWAFLGLESATIPAGEIDRPSVTIGRATILGTVIAAAIYIFGTTAVMGIMPREMLLNSTAPFADAAGLMWGPWAAWLVAIGAVISCLGALNGWILVAGQIPLAVARNGLFPALFGRTSRTGTPIPALLIAAVLMTTLVCTNYSRGLVGMFTFIILLATLTTLVPYLFSSMALLVIARRDRSRLSRKQVLRSVLLGVLAFVYSLWAVVGAGYETIFWGSILLISGVPVYLWMTWRKRGTS